MKRKDREELAWCVAVSLGVLLLFSIGIGAMCFGHVDGMKDFWYEQYQAERDNARRSSSYLQSCQEQRARDLEARKIEKLTGVPSDRCDRQGRMIFCIDDDGVWDEESVWQGRWR